MMGFRADLHCHSTFSDGTLTPQELVALAVEKGLQGLVITDHDNVDSYPEVFKAAAAAGIRMVSGVEFSSQHQGEPVHILGYSFNLESEAITALCRRHSGRRRARNCAILDKLAEKGMALDKSAFEFDVGTMGRPHIAQALVDRGYVASIQEAFKQWIGDGRPCYASGEPITTVETIEAIHQAGGVAILAHPHLIKQQRTIPGLLSLPFDGLEGYYALIFPKEEERWVQIAKQRDWLITGGSDFHGAVKPAIPLGASWVGEETFSLLEQRYASHDN